METNDIPVRCCRCKNRHNESERIFEPKRSDHGITESTCPRCGARSYYNMAPMVAYCWASGLIEFSESVPHGAIKIAHGPKAFLEVAVKTRARHGRGESEGKFLVPGVPEAPNQRAAGEALKVYLDWASNGRTAKKNGVVFTSVEVA